MKSRERLVEVTRPVGAGCNTPRVADKRPPTLLTEIERDLLDGTPIADVLRKLIVLGGRAGSSELRDWASQELRGYLDTASLPEYRKVPAPIQLDAVAGHTIIRGQTISPFNLPDVARDVITNRTPFTQGIGEIEELARSADGAVKIGLPGHSELARIMDAESGRPFQRIDTIYWSVSRAALAGLVDQVRTRLAELLGELRAVTPANADVPTAAQANNAVNVVVHGRGNHVQIAQAHEGGNSSIDETPPPADSSFWTRGRRLGAILVGIATIAGAVFAAIQIWG